jgi:hypothetical protein
VSSAINLGESIVPVIHHEQKLGMGTFRKGLTTSPFQIPFLAYLFLQGILIMLSVPGIAHGLQVPAWSIWNFAIVLTVGSGMATFSRFNGNERLEELSLWLVALAAIIAVGIEGTAKDYGGLGDDIAILLGCLLRIRVLRTSRKAEKVAVEIAIKNGENT